MTKRQRSLPGQDTVWAVLTVIAMAVTTLQAADKISSKAVKPYPLYLCIVPGEALDGDIGGPFRLVENGQEIKLCYKDRLDEFEKDRDRVLK